MFSIGLHGAILRTNKNTQMHRLAIAGARAYIWGSGGRSPLKLMMFVPETLIFDAFMIVYNKITILMIHMLPFNVAQRAFKDTHSV